MEPPMSSRDADLLDACKHHSLREADAHLATIPEPYVPFVPPDWNGTLVLAEAQNHGRKSENYLA